MNWIVHIILLILGEIWSKGGNLTGLLLANVSAEVAKVNPKALNIKSYQPGAKNCRRSAKAKCIFIMLPRHFICHSKKCWNSRAAPHSLPLSTIWKTLQKGSSLLKFVCLFQVKFNFSFENIFFRSVSWHEKCIDL